MTPATPEPWMDDALCAETDPEIFFPRPGAAARDYDTKLALAICANCDVRTPCLTYALASDDRGIWGGTTEKQRAKMRRKAS